MRDRLARTGPSQGSGTRTEATVGLELTKTCHGTGRGLDYAWLGEKPSSAASCSVEKADAQVP